MKVLVIGYGSMGRRHATNASALGHTVRVYDPRFGYSAGKEVPPDDAMAGFVENVAAGYEWEPDAAVVAVPAARHLDELFGLLNRTRARVLVEKPMVLDTQLAPEIEAWTGLVGRRLRVAYNLRHHLGVLKLQRRLSEVGEVRRARFWMKSDMRAWPGAEYADALLEYSHELDLARFLLGPFAVERAQTWGDTSWSLDLCHASGALSHVLIDARCRHYWRGCEIWGSDACLNLDWNAPSGGSAVWSDPREEDRSVAYDYVSPEGTYRAELAAFLAGETAGASVEEALGTLQAVAMARAAAARSFHP